MSDQDTIVINADLQIPIGELAFRFSRSSGPGGQHVNRSETQVELLFDVAGSPSLTENQRQLLTVRLGQWLDSDGTLHHTSSKTRSQHQNRQATIARLRDLLQRALRPRIRRRPTQPSRATMERRLEDKRRQAAKKRARRRPTAEEN